MPIAACSSQEVNFGVLPKRKQSDVVKTEDRSSSKERKRPSQDEWSKSKKKRMGQLKAKQSKKDFPEKTSNLDGSAISEKTTSLDNSPLETPSSEPKGVKTSSALHKTFMARLTDSRFRELNEVRSVRGAKQEMAQSFAASCTYTCTCTQTHIFRFCSIAQELYTTTSSTAFDRFSSNPELYEHYHDGFRHQVEQWPVNPVEMITKWLDTNFRKQSPCVVADFGCGDAALAKKLVGCEHKGTCPFCVHSFDLVASSDRVTACDMANVPLENRTVDVAVFCLSLMGTNLADFKDELK